MNNATLEAGWARAKILVYPLSSSLIATANPSGQGSDRGHHSMRTGITQEQVNAAAHTILGAGENATVEKIRASLGTGSPNTVTRMLDASRNRLGERLREMSVLPDVPGSVGRAMVDLWRLAVNHAGR
jgi:hypothetical protein